MNLLGIDYGDSKIGIAISSGTLAEPYAIFKTKDYLKIKDLCRKLKIEKIIIGYSEGITAQKTSTFAVKLKKIIDLPIEYQDETLTTHDAIAKMKEIGKHYHQEDAISAAIILQDYLDNHSYV